MVLLAFAGTAPFARADMVTDWNVIALDTIPAMIMGPPQARLMGYVQAAVFDAVNSVERRYAPYAVDLKVPHASAEAAAAAAAHGMLIRFYPSQKATVDARLSRSLASIPDNKTKNAGIELGAAVAETMYGLSLNDGSDATDPVYTPGRDPWSWRPTAPDMQPRGLIWGRIKPFMLKSADQFAFPGPHKVTSAQYAKDLEEVRLLGGVNSTLRTADQTAVAIFWTGSPTSVYNAVARTVGKAKGNSLIDNARLFALLNMAGSDASVATWHQKYTSNFLRPVTAIRNADKLDNPALTKDADWTPLLVTPPHPDYPSAHCAIAGASTGVLRLFFDADAMDANYTYPPLGVTRRWTGFSQIAEELDNARVWGGIHTRTADEHARMVGGRIAELAFTKFLKPAEGAAQADSPPRGARAYSPAK
ncbi:MAG: vanadium-dependent haloperoxidase [Actinomycetes bacterium]